MSDIITKHSKEFEKGIAFLAHSFNSLHAGRAHPSMVESTPILVYGSTMKLIELASITSPDPREILVSPWDKSIVKNIIAGIKKGRPEMQITGDANTVRLTVPLLTEESRKKMKKKLNEAIEQAKVRIRQARDKVKEEITMLEKNKEISEDDKFSHLKKLDETTQKYTKEIDDLGMKKMEEIMTV